MKKASSFFAPIMLILCTFAGASQGSIEQNDLDVLVGIFDSHSEDNIKIFLNNIPQQKNNFPELTKALEVFKRNLTPEDYQSKMVKWKKDINELVKDIEIVHEKIRSKIEKQMDNQQSPLLPTASGAPLPAKEENAFTKKKMTLGAALLVLFACAGNKVWSKLIEKAKGQEPEEESIQRVSDIIVEKEK